jgi:hypothetical protein
MQKILGALIVGLLVLLTDTSYADTEIFGGFSVNSVFYQYQYSGLSPGQPAPRCSCDYGLGQECPIPHYSLVDLGPKCYDWGESAYAREFTRLTSASDTAFEVKGGNAWFPAPNTGIVLTSPSGTKCFLITIDETGSLHSTQTACP